MLLKVTNLKRGFYELVCIAVFVMLFSFVTILRPPAVGAMYKEVIIAVLVLCLYYVNRYVLYPHFYLKLNIGKYIIFSLLCIFFVAVAEIILIYPQLDNTLSAISTPDESKRAFFVYFLLICSRDMALFLITYILCNMLVWRALNEKYEFRLRRTYNEIMAFDISSPISLDSGYRTSAEEMSPVSSEKVLGRDLGTDNSAFIEATHYVSVIDILYCEQFKNSTMVHTVDMNILIRNSSLKKTIVLLGEENVLQISKDVIVSKTYIDDFDGQHLTITVPKNNTTTTLEVSSKYKKNVLLVLEQLKSSQQKNSIPDVNEKSAEWRMSELLQKEKHHKVYFYVRNNPLCKAEELSDKLNIRAATLNRILKQLKADGLITYEGSKKTGGYRVVSS